MIRFMQDLVTFLGWTLLATLVAVVILALVKIGVKLWRDEF